MYYVNSVIIFLEKSWYLCRMGKSLIILFNSINYGSMHKSYYMAHLGIKWDYIGLAMYNAYWDYLA